METGNGSKPIWSLRKIIAVTIGVLVLAGSFFLYTNFNRLLSEALLKTFNSHVISDVYELKFENLRVNLVSGSIRVMNVSILPREQPSTIYPYINGSFRLSTNELNLENVAILDLLRSNTLNLDRISILRPQIDLRVEGKRLILFPFSDSTVTSQPKADTKKVISNFLLQSFELVEANLHTNNLALHREFRVEGLTVRMDSLLINQRPGVDVVALGHGELLIRAFDGRMKQGAFRHLRFGELKFAVDSLGLQSTLDTVKYRAKDTRLALGNLDMQTKDSLFHVTLRSFDLSSYERMVRMKGVQFTPNFSFESMQQKYEFVHTDVSASAGSVEVSQMDFFSLVHTRQLFIGEIHVDSVEAILFADLTKPRDPKKKPPYLGQTVAGLAMPLRINRVRATNVHLTNRERKKDSTMAEVHLTRATVELSNITNMSNAQPLVLKAEALLAGKTHFKASLAFDYRKPEFRFNGILDRFNLPDLNPVIEAYTPAKITKGVADEISFSGIAGETASTGTMKFLYHDLEVDVHLKKKAKWMSSVLTFTANTALHSSNPVSDSKPPRVVTFKVEREMNKGFINLLIKSLLNGLKETMFMSKENKKAYKEAQRKAKE